LAGESLSMRLDPTAEGRIGSWIDGYRPLPGIPDEFIGRDGAPSAHWERFINALASFEPDEVKQRFAAADRRIREMGISYRAYGDVQERPWPLSRLPLLISESDWRDISAGIEQRARLHEAILADLYGQARLVEEGALPAAAVAGSPEFLRSLCGVTPPGGRWLHLYAADIGRGPDGRWWVLGDRAQAPSGSGYALENRLVTSRAFPALYQQLKVERLAPFFRAFRDGLSHSAERADPRICLLTPGPFSETYFEQAYLARYLGFLLVEGGDLVVADRRVHVRTIAGLKRADVVLRRIDGDWCDPLELNARSRIGVPGFIEAIREGSVAVGNMPGTGLVESRAMLSFMPALARRLLDEDLRLPNIATWWCGQPAARAHVLESLDHLAISGAFTDSVPGFADATLVGADLDEKARARLRARIAARGVDYVGQEVVRLSTTPVWNDGVLSPRPFVLRIFAAATPDGWRIMPGGFCRVSNELDARAVSMAEGVQSADVWVLSDKPVEMTTLLPTDDNVKVVRLLGNLPSRAADNLFWFGRYLERAEATLRLVRGLFNRAIDADALLSSARAPIGRLRGLLTAWGATDEDDAASAPADVAMVALQSTENYGSVLELVRDVRRSASAIRERLSQDVWRFLARFESCIEEAFPAHASEPQLMERIEDALSIIAGLSGLIAENFNRVAGWNFLDMGRRIERGVIACRFARHFADNDATAENLDMLLDLIDSQITYRSRYIVGVSLAPVLDMAILDPFNPRSVGFQAVTIDNHLSSLPTLREDGMLEAPRQLSIKLRAALETEAAGRLDATAILAYEQQVIGLGEAIASRYFLQGSNIPRTEKMTGLA